MRHDEVMICTQRGIFYATEHMQYVDGRMEFRTNFNIIHGARGGDRMVDPTKNVTKCITFIGKIEKAACQ